MWIIRITPYLFCNSIQESNNSVFDSRSCTHVLIQGKDYASKYHKKIFETRKTKPLGVFGFESTQEEEGEQNTNLCVYKL